MIRSLEISRLVVFAVYKKLRHAFTRYRQGPRVDLRDIDVVMLWCDPSDPVWFDRRLMALQASDRNQLCQINLQPSRPEVVLGELQFSLRSIDSNLRGFRRLYLVVDRQLPPWLDQSDPRLRIVEVEDLLPDPSLYPTFNTQAIESYFFRIPGLSERFVYFNDDFFLTKPTEVASYFTADGRMSVRLGRALSPKGAVSSDEEGDHVGHKNSNRALDEKFGKKPRLTVMHRPYPHIKAVMRRAASEFSEEFESTRRSRFRSLRMHAIHSFLIPYAAGEVGDADLVPPSLLEKDLLFWSSDRSNNKRTINHLRAARHSAFCIQEDRDNAVDEEAARDFLDFMEELYPEPSAFEK